ncbi:MAG: EthD domain-containing protein [Sphingomonadaceae bacterium]|nr:EthD domain-containing protein [Sphingomonadaceae bacterium]
MSGCKVIALLRKRAELTRAEFIDYYETRHAPLILSLLPNIKRYSRNFADFSGAFALEGAAPFDFDCVTEISFASRSDYDAFLAVAAKDEIAQTIASDEENFLDRSGTRMFLVDEHSSDISP